MKNLFIVLLLGLLVAGCESTTEKIESIVDDPGTLLQDPGFASYEQNMNRLEKQYLRKEITYAEYLEKKAELEEDYVREAQPHQASVEDPEAFKGDNETLR